MPLDNHLFDIQRVIQLAIAPVFFLTAIGTFINALTGRLARAVDRRRVLEVTLPEGDGPERDTVLSELGNLAKRIKLVLWSVALAVMAALFICLLIGFAFVGAYLGVDLTEPVALLFIAAVIALTGCLLLFLREVALAAITVRYPKPLRSPEVRK